RDGEWKILPRYDNACTFREGYAGVLLDGYGVFINRDGDMVFERIAGLGPGYYLYFKEGRALFLEVPEGEPVTGRTVKYGYFINDGRRIPAIYDVVSDFSGGFGRVMIDGRKRLIDENGSWVMWADEIEMLYGFQDGIARATKDGKYGFIDRNGVWVIQPEYDSLFEFSEGCAAAGKDGKLGYIDINGEWLF
ncbi:MAG: WG repeat-containing protein, partial [Treponema sp.]|nr:WG repeat-containing protein [Treponema sp.]